MIAALYSLDFILALVKDSEYHCKSNSKEINFDTYPCFSRRDLRKYKERLRVDV